MHLMIEEDTFDNLYIQLCNYLINKGEEIVLVNGKKTIELCDTTLILTNPTSRLLTIEKRDLSYKYLAGEFAFYFSQSNKLKFISHYSKFWNRVSDDKDKVNSAYGYRIFGITNEHGYTQFDYAIDKLKEDINTRKAVMIITTPENSYDSKDNICTMTIQLLIRDNKLYMINNMRSNDIWFGLSYDLPFFTTLQEMILVILRTEKYTNLELGKYIHHSGSTHFYYKDKHDIDLIRNIATEPMIKMHKDFLPTIHYKEARNKLNDFVRAEKRYREEGVIDTISIDSSIETELFSYLINTY